LKLKRARKTLLHALIWEEEMEAETRVEGKIALGRVMFLLGDIEAAQQQTERALEEARQFESTWLIARAQRVLGSIYATQKQEEQAVSCFEQALRTFRKTEMRLEYARTLHQYGEMLVQQEDGNEKAYQRGLGYLREAHEIFGKCKAGLDLQVVERVLVMYEQVSRV
jgi:tetratricopeptide (TPR) repeat protein